MNHQTSYRLLSGMITSVVLACASLPALADSFVTGAGVSADGHFTLAGRVAFNSREQATGKITIIEQLDARSGSIVSVICNYNEFSGFTVNGNTASFTSTGVCRTLNDNGGGTNFVSENSFAISDNGEPGVGLDSIDVNFLGASGISIPGGVLMHGNFVVGDTAVPAAR